VYYNGRMPLTVKGTLQMLCASPKLFKTPYGYTLLNLNKKICEIVNVGEENEINKLYYYHHIIMKNSSLMYIGIKYLFPIYISLNCILYFKCLLVEV